MTTTFDPANLPAALDYNPMRRDLDNTEDVAFPTALVVLRRYDRPRVSWGVHLLTCDTIRRGWPRFRNDIVGLASTTQVYATLATGRFGPDMLPDVELAHRTEFGRFGARVVSDYVRYQILPIEWQDEVPWHRVWMFRLEHLYRFDPLAAASMGSHYAETWSAAAWRREHEHNLG